MLIESMEVIPLMNGKVRLEVTLPDRSNAGMLEELAQSGKQLNMEIKKYRKPRSVQANAYLWTLLDKMAAKLMSTKEEIYHEAIRQVGLYKEFEMTSEAIKEVASDWMGKGSGWLVEVSPTVIHEGYRVVRFYSGSSVYNTEQMSRLIDFVVQEAKDLGIETMTPNEIAEMMAKMEEKYGH